MRSQNFSDLYMDAAQCYWYNVMKIKDFSDLKTLYVKLNRFEFMDVDNIEDFNVQKNLKKLIKYKNKINLEKFFY